MCCSPTREAMILGGGFRTVAGSLLFPRGAQRFPRPLQYVLPVYLNLEEVCKPLTLQVLKIWRRGRDSNLR